MTADQGRDGSLPGAADRGGVPVARSGDYGLPAGADRARTSSGIPGHRIGEDE